MIFVATGTTGFDALAQKMDELTPSLNEDVCIQIGQGTYIPNHATYFRFAPSLEPYYEQASLVISHGGMGICMEALQHGKPLIALSNPDRYDDHQQDILSALAKQNYLVWCKHVDKLPDTLKDNRHQLLKQYTAPKCEIHLVIKDFLNSLDQRKGDP